MTGVEVWKFMHPPGAPPHYNTFGKWGGGVNLNF